jgi:1-pyrroline-5-carboxylate dehydrogenase
MTAENGYAGLAEQVETKHNGLAPFVNEPFEDFADEGTSRAMTAALELVRAQLGREYSMVVGGRRVSTAGKISSVNPARPVEVVGIHQAATDEDVEPAIQAALAAFPAWSAKPMQERADLLLRAAALIRERKFEFCAWLTFEVGKNWAEADADVGETIDFLEFYAREALRLDSATTPIQFPGERNRLRYLPLGVGAVIPPWNFPLAIMAGMTSAAIVCGNTVILKPSVDAPTIAAIFFALLEEVGLPAGVVNFCPGEGPGFGAAVVAHPETRFVAFTGSKKVGLEIHESAARDRPGQKFIRRTILEMGGKDAILVDADCDLDAAVEGVVASAFGFNGQKCSACSRAIVDEAVYEGFCERLVARVAKMQQGDPAQNLYAGPVISKTALERVLGYIEIGRGEGKLIAGGAALDSTRNPDGGYYVQPTLFRDVAPNARIAQEEIFGPVLAVISAENFGEALAIANGTEYGLTGAVYSCSRAKLDQAALEFQVGNLYFNRKCTGAMVGAHPFGGFNMSGTDSKAGGPDYLLLFTQAKSIAEKIGTVSEPKERQERGFGL